MIMGKPTYDELINQNKMLVSYAEQHKDGLKKLLQLNSLLDNLSKDPEQNIKLIVQNAKLLLNDSTVFYNYFGDKDHEKVILLPKNSDHYIWKAAVIQQNEKASYIGYPIIALGKTIGVFGIMNNCHRVYSEIEIYIIRMLAITLSLEEERKITSLEIHALSKKKDELQPLPEESKIPHPVLSKKSNEKEEQYRKLLKECTQSLFLLSKHINEGAIFVDESGSFIYANPIFQNITAYSENEIIGLSLNDIFSSKERQKISDELRVRSASHFSKKTLNSEIICRNKEIYAIDMTLFTMHWQSRKITVITFRKALSFHKASSASATQMEQTFSVLLDHFPAGVVICDRDAHVVFTNKYFYDFMDPLKNSEAISQLYLPPAFSDQTLHNIPNLVEEGVMEIVKTLYDEKGNERIFRTFRIPILIEGLQPLYGTVVIEITKQIHLEKSLQEDIASLKSESKKYNDQIQACHHEASSEKNKRKSIQKAFRRDKIQHLNLIKIMNQVVLSLDMHGVIKKINTFTKELFGFQRHELIGHSLLSFIHPDDIAAASATLDEFIQSNPDSFNEMSFRVISKKGITQWYEIKLHSQTDSEGKTELITTTLTDVTEKIMIKEQLSQETFMASVGHLSATLAKEIDLSLKLIENTMKLVHQDYQLNIGLARKLSLIKEAVNAIQFKTQYLIEANEEKKGKKTPIAINPLLHDAIALFENYLKEQHIRTEMKLINESYRVMAYAGELRQVFINIIFRLSEMITEHHYVHSDQHQLDSLLVIESYYDSRQMVIKLGDNGPSIDKNELHHLFDRSYESRENKKGLAYCYDIVKSHHGIIRVKNNSHGGVTFKIKLPLAGISK